MLDIAPDGSFYKKFQASYPICQRFYTLESKVDFGEIPFFARPGETIDITVSKALLTKETSSPTICGRT